MTFSLPRSLRVHWSELVGPQSGQRFLAVEFPGQTALQAAPGEVLPALVEAKTSHLTEQGED